MQHRSMGVLTLAMTLLPWLMVAEERFGDGEGDKKKQFVLDAVTAGGSAMITRFGVPTDNVADFETLCADAIDIGVHLNHYQGVFRADKDKVESACKALALPAPTGPIATVAKSDQTS